MYPLRLSFRAHIITHSPSDPPFHILAPTKPLTHALEGHITRISCVQTISHLSLQYRNVSQCGTVFFSGGGACGALYIEFYKYLKQ